MKRRKQELDDGAKPTKKESAPKIVKRKSTGNENAEDSLENATLDLSNSEDEDDEDDDEETVSPTSNKRVVLKTSPGAVVRKEAKKKSSKVVKKSCRKVYEAREGSESDEAEDDRASFVRRALAADSRSKQSPTKKR